jgi:hypothetical protein
LTVIFHPFIAIYGRPKHVASALAITVPINDVVATILEDTTGPVTAVFKEVNLLATDVFRPIVTVTFAL